MSSRLVFARYLLLQLPGWTVVLIVLILVRHYLGLSFAAAALIFALWVVKDLVLFRFLRGAYEMDARTVVERLIGEVGSAMDDLAPRGYVRVRGELWRAEVGNGHPAIAAGRAIKVAAVRDSVLIVVARG